MANPLLEKLKRSRESGVTVEGHVFTIRRPTVAEASSIPPDGDPLAYLAKFVVGWDLTELDVIPGGGPEKVPYDADVFVSWVADQPAYWKPLGEAIKDAYERHAKATEAAEKN